MKNRKFVLVNMDETGTAHADTMKRGYSVQEMDDTERRHERYGVARGTADYTDMKTSLLGVICNNAALQPHLPQFVLPKFRQKAMPPQYLQDAYDAMGYPLIIKHGTTGWNDDATMREFLLELRSIVYAHDPQLWILLVVDNSRIHVARKMLSYMKSLGILILLIPAKLTWLLQMLDVYVFAEYKRRLRRMTTEAVLSNPEGRMTTGAWVPLLGDATQQILVRADWSRTFSKCGLAADVNLVRQSIREYLVRVLDRNPRKPTEEELLDLMSLPPPAQRFQTLSWRTLLCGLPESLLTEPARLPPVASARALPAGVLPSMPLSPAWVPVAEAPVGLRPLAQGALFQDPTVRPVAKAASRKRELPGTPADSIASRTRSRTAAKATPAPTAAASSAASRSGGSA